MKKDESFVRVGSGLYNRLKQDFCALPACFFAPFRITEQRLPFNIYELKSKSKYITEISKDAQEYYMWTEQRKEAKNKKGRIICDLFT